MTEASVPLASLDLHEPRDIALARQRAQAVAQRLGFEAQDQARLATAVSEVARLSIRLAEVVRLSFALEQAGGADALVAIRADGRTRAGEALPPDRIAGLPEIDAARRLVDHFRVDPGTGGGFRVLLSKALPRRVPAITPAQAGAIADELARLPLASPVDELLRQNREQLRLLDDLRNRELELAQLNRELEETNRGVVALYNELDERAESLKRASELKTRFLSNVSHEFRTPLTSVLSLGRLLLDGEDGQLNDEQERQVRYILRAAHDLLGMVNDLLDLARIEAGRDEVVPSTVTMPEFFGLMRGMLRPLLPEDSPVELFFEVDPNVPALWTDEGKLAQVVRNLVSNALKFTERGEVRVRAALADSEALRITVADTGVGIDPRHFERIFEEFGQVDNPLQRRSKGTGLGLPLALRLTQLLGGGLEVASRLGAGATFTMTLPLVGVPTDDCDPIPDQHDRNRDLHDAQGVADA